MRSLSVTEMLVLGVGAVLAFNLFTKDEQGRGFVEKAVGGVAETAGRLPGEALTGLTEGVVQGNIQSTKKIVDLALEPFKYVSRLVGAPTSEQISSEADAAIAASRGRGEVHIMPYAGPLLPQPSGAMTPEQAVTHATGALPQDWSGTGPFSGPGITHEIPKVSPLATLSQRIDLQPKSEFMPLNPFVAALPSPTPQGNTVAGNWSFNWANVPTQGRGSQLLGYKFGIPIFDIEGADVTNLTGTTARYRELYG